MEDQYLRYMTTVLAIAAGTASGLYAVVRFVTVIVAKKISEFMHGYERINDAFNEFRRDLDALRQQLNTVQDILYSTIEVLESHGTTTKASAKKRVLRH